MNRRGMPSMVALLGLLAVAGYQNREKLTEMFRNMAQKKPGEGNRQDGLGGILENLGGVLGGAGAGRVLSGGLGDLVDRLRNSGQSETADSWVRKGPNQPIAPDDLERAIGPEILAALSERTGLSRQDLLTRLTRALPEAVDNLTPDGRLPTEQEADRLVEPQAGRS
jgi:uncharacterized protein YidB (DUF937 family)